MLALFPALLVLVAVISFMPVSSLVLGEGALMTYFKLSKAVSLRHKLRSSDPQIDPQILR